jgi:hypothetical protein
LLLWLLFLHVYQHTYTITTWLISFFCFWRSVLLKLIESEKLQQSGNSSFLYPSRFDIMTTIHRLTSSLMLLLLVHTSLLWTPSTAFVVVVKPFTTSVATQQSSSRMTTIRRTMSESSTTESAFVPLDGGDDGDDEDYDDEVPLETIESLGRGAAKVSA